MDAAATTDDVDAAATDGGPEVTSSAAAAAAALCRRRKQPKPRQLTAAESMETTSASRDVADNTEDLRCRRCGTVFVEAQLLSDHLMVTCQPTSTDLGVGPDGTEAAALDDADDCDEVDDDEDEGHRQQQQQQLFEVERRRRDVDASGSRHAMGLDQRMFSTSAEILDDEENHSGIGEDEVARHNHRRHKTTSHEEVEGTTVDRDLRASDCYTSRGELKQLRGTSCYDGDEDDAENDDADEVELNNEELDHGGRMEEELRHRQQQQQRLLVGDFLASQGGMTGSSAAAAAMMFENNLSPASKIAVLESYVYALHQQQMFQLELIDTLRRQLLAAVTSNPSGAAAAATSGSGVGVAPSSSLDLRLPRPSADISSSPELGSLNSLMRLSDAVDPRRPRHVTAASPLPVNLDTSSTEHNGFSSSAGHNSSALTTSVIRGSHQPPLPSMFPPPSTSSMAMMSDWTRTALSAAQSTNKQTATTFGPSSSGGLSDLSLFKKGKPPNVTVQRSTDSQQSSSSIDLQSSAAGTSGAGGPPGAEDCSPSVFRHRCRLCLKVLGSDSALQIHMRSHTGERPYKCNICGNRFTTKGNLKVHFQRHLEQYPNARMNPDPVPEYLDHPGSLPPPPAQQPLTPSSSFGHHLSSIGLGGKFLPPELAALQSLGKAAESRTSAGNRPVEREQTNPTVESANVPNGMTPFGGLINPSSIKTESLTAEVGTHFAVQKNQKRGSMDLSADAVRAGAAQQTQPSNPSNGSLSSSSDGGIPFPSPLTALSSMSSALSAFAPQLRMNFPPPGGLGSCPQPPIAAGGPFGVGGTGVGVGHQSFGPLLEPPSIKDDDDDDLEQYMEIQQTDTARIEELVREATEGRAGEGTSDPNECVICHRVLSCRSALLMHYRTHTGERPYRCRLCGRTFTTKGNLKTHMAVHRGRISGSHSSSSGIGGASLGGHRCRVCRREFPGGQALQHHVRVAHGDQFAPGGGLPAGFPGVPPINPAAGPNASAAAVAAATMMMVPGMNPLLPFFNFPFFGGAAAGAPHGFLSHLPPQMSTALNHLEGHDGEELDLRKSIGGRDNDYNAKNRSRVDEDDGDDQGPPPDKRLRVDADSADDEVDSRRIHIDNERSNASDYGRVKSLASNDDEGSAAADNRSDFDDYDDDEFGLPLASRQRGSSPDGGEMHARENSSTPENRAPNSTDQQHQNKFFSPLMALEQRVNSLGCSNMFAKFGSGTGVTAGWQGMFSGRQEPTRPASGSVASNDYPSSAAGSSDNEQGRSSADRFNKVEMDDSNALDPMKNGVHPCHLPLSGIPSTEPSLGQGFPGQRGRSSSGLDADAASSCPSASPGSGPFTAGRPGSSGSGGSSTYGSAAPPVHPDTGSVHGHSNAQQPQQQQQQSGPRFTCSVCDKGFASQSALDIHSRTHTGDRPFVCTVCSKAFTTKGNLKVHMGTHAWNRCPSRRGRRMTVVDPATAAAVAAGGGFPPASTPPKDPFYAAQRFLTETPRSMPIFGYAAGSPPMGRSIGSAAGLFPDSKALLNYYLQSNDMAEKLQASAAEWSRMVGAGAAAAAAMAANPGAGGLFQGAGKDERNNNNNRASTNNGAGVERGGVISAPGGELDLSARGPASTVGYAVDQTTNIRGWTADRASAGVPLMSNCS